MILKGQVRQLLLILAFGVFGILNTEMGVIGILPHVAARFHISITEAGLLVSGFAMGVAIAGPTLPLLFSRVNRKYIMLVVSGVFFITTAVTPWVTDFYTALLLRILPALLHPIYCSLAFAVAAGSVPAAQAPRAVSYITVGVSAGMVIGVPVSNFLASVVSLDSAYGFFAVVNGVAFLLTALKIPSMPVSTAVSYGEQLRILKKPILWISLAGAVFINGTVFGVFGYAADYFANVVALSPAVCSAILFLYGIMNIVGSIWAGRLLVQVPKATVCLLPPALLIVYMALYGYGDRSIVAIPLTVLWGLLGGINANVTQYWVYTAAPEAPDFVNGLFLTAVNIGTTVGALWCGYIIAAMHLEAVVLGGIVMAIISFLLILWRYSLNE